MGCHVSPLSPLEVPWAYQQNTKEGGFPPDDPSEAIWDCKTKSYELNTISRLKRQKLYFQIEVKQSDVTELNLRNNSYLLYLFYI